MTNWIISKEDYENKVEKYIEGNKIEKYIEGNSFTELSTGITTKYHLPEDEEVFVTSGLNEEKVGILCNKFGKVSKDIGKLIGRKF